MTTYTATNGAIIADLTALIAIPSTDLPATGFVALFVAAENSWYEYDSALTSGDVTPTDSPATGRWLRIAREQLRANRTYYVRTDGNDANTGLADTSGGAFLTIQRFFSVLNRLDKNGFSVTCKIADGTYSITQSIATHGGVGIGDVIVEGNTTTPANVVLTSAVDNLYYFDKQDPSFIFIRGIRFTNTAVSPITSTITTFINCNNGFLGLSNLDFGTITAGTLTAQSHIVASGNGIIYLLGNYTISASAVFHWLCTTGGKIRDYITVNPSGTPITVTITGTPAITVFAFARGAGAMIDVFFSRVVFSGSATGMRYDATLNSVIASYGGGATYLPGNTSGTTATGGQYS